MAVRASPLVVAGFLSCLTGCLNEPPAADPVIVPPPAVLFTQDGEHGAAWLWFPAGAHGNVTVLARMVPGIPFALQATWIGAEVRPLVQGFELNVRHQEGVVAAGAAGTSAGFPGFPIWSPADVWREIALDEDAPGHLVVAWGAVPQGIEVRAMSLRERPAAVAAGPASFLDLVVDAQAFAYTPAVQAAEQRAEGAAPALLNLRLIVPGNAGQGRVSLETPAWAWERAVGPPPADTGCIDCATIERYVASAPEGWRSALLYAGVSGNFQAYLLAAEVPADVRLAMPAGIQQFPDCVEAFVGCRA